MKRKPLTGEQLAERDRRQRETHAEYGRLKERWPALRENMTPSAILLAWFLLGDDALEHKQS